MKQYFDLNWRKHRQQKRVSLTVALAASMIALATGFFCKKPLDYVNAPILYERYSIEDLQQLRSETRDRLIIEVDRYISFVNPKSEISSPLIVDNSLEHNMDISLLLSQAHLESQCGRLTGGTSSVCGVAKRYSTQDEAIVDYIRLMKSRYVPDGRTTEMLISDGFTAYKSKKYKYAEDPDYPYKIDSIRKKILATTKIYELQEACYSYDIAIAERAGD